MKRIIIISTALLITGLLNAAAAKSATTSTSISTSALAAATTAKPHSLVTLTAKLYTDLASSTNASSLCASYPSYAAGLMATQLVYTQMPDVVNALKANPKTGRLHDLLDQAGTLGTEILQELETTSPITGQIPEITKLLSSIQALSPLFSGSTECQNCGELTKKLLASQTELVASQKALSDAQTSLVDCKTEQLKLSGELTSTLRASIEIAAQLKATQAQLQKAQTNLVPVLPDNHS